MARLQEEQMRREYDRKRGLLGLWPPSIGAMQQMATEQQGATMGAIQPGMPVELDYNTMTYRGVSRKEMSLAPMTIREELQAETDKWLAGFD
jgi:hypothetical protein